MSELLASPGGTRALLDRFGIRPRKKYGQNFLIDRGVIDAICAAAEISKEDCVLEIGPGIGTMTQLLSRAAGRVIAIEVDRTLEPVLAYTLEDCVNVTVHWDDVLKTDLPALRDALNEGRPFKCVSNLPYSVTTPVLMRLFQEKECFTNITVMVQKEVADRMLSGAGEKDYGALSLAVQYAAEPERVLNVPPSCFLPRPGVDSEVVTMRVRTVPPVEADEEFLFALIRASFNQRRKTLANALSHGLQGSGPAPEAAASGESAATALPASAKDGRRAAGYSISRMQVQEALRGMGLAEDIRGEKLSLEQFAELSRRLSAL